MGGFLLSLLFHFKNINMFALLEDFKKLVKKVRNLFCRVQVLEDIIAQNGFTTTTTTTTTTSSTTTTTTAP